MVLNLTNTLLISLHRRIHKVCCEIALVIVEVEYGFLMQICWEKKGASGKFIVGFHIKRQIEMAQYEKTLEVRNLSHSLNSSYLTNFLCRYIFTKNEMWSEFLRFRVEIGDQMDDEIKCLISLRDDKMANIFLIWLRHRVLSKNQHKI